MDKYDLDDFFKFKKFITPHVIHNIYMVGNVLIFFSGLALAFIKSIVSGLLFMLVIILIGIPLSLLIWRLICEGSILFYKIYEKL